MLQKSFSPEQFVKIDLVQLLLLLDGVVIGNESTGHHVASGRFVTNGTRLEMPIVPLQDLISFLRLYLIDHLVNFICRYLSPKYRT